MGFLERAFLIAVITANVLVIIGIMSKKKKNKNNANSSNAAGNNAYGNPSQGGKSAKQMDAERERQMVESSMLPHLMGMKIIEMMKSLSANPDFPDGLYMDFKVRQDKYEFVVHHPAGYTDTIDASFMQVKNANRQEWGADVIDKEFDYLFTYAGRECLERILMEKYISKVPGFAISGNRITKKRGAGPKVTRDLSNFYTYYAVKAMLKNLIGPDNEQMAEMRNATKSYALVAKPTELEVWFEGWNTNAPTPFRIEYAKMNDNPEYRNKPELLFTSLNSDECKQLVEKLTRDIENECPYFKVVGNRISYM